MNIELEAKQWHRAHTQPTTSTRWKLAIECRFMCVFWRPTKRLKAHLHTQPRWKKMKRRCNGNSTRIMCDGQWGAQKPFLRPFLSFLWAAVPLLQFPFHYYHRCHWLLIPITSSMIAVLINLMNRTKHWIKYQSLISKRGNEHRNISSWLKANHYRYYTLTRNHNLRLT